MHVYIKMIVEYSDPGPGVLRPKLRSRTGGGGDGAVRGCVRGDPSSAVHRAMIHH